MLRAAALDTAPLFDRIDFSAHGTVVAAVSGGSDSTALLLLLKQYLDRAAPTVRLVAITVDHALRAGSADEARQVAAFCARIGVDRVTKVWAGAKPSAGLAAAARDARYRLLAGAARELGATLIFLGHTADDQAETVFMRAGRGEGRGLAGMAPATLLDGKFWLLRPLLGVRREALRDLLRGKNLGWIDDPSNDNPAYERVRARRGLEKSRDIEALLAQGAAAARRRIEFGRSAAALIAAHASLAAPGLVRVDAGFLPLPWYADLGTTPLTGSLREPPLPRKAGERRAGRDFAPLLSPILLGGSEGRARQVARPGMVVRRTGEGAATLTSRTPNEPFVSDADAARYALRLLLAVVGGRSDLPSETATDELLAKLAAGTRRGVLSRAVIDVRGGSIWLHRELRNLRQPDAMAEDDAWDGRFRMTSAAPAEQDKRQSVHPDAPPALLRAAAATMPALADPTLRAVPIAAPWARLMPSFDLAPACAVLRLVGGDLPPPLPYAGHSEGEA